MGNVNLTWLDLVVVVLVGASAGRGLVRGLVREGLAFVGLAVGLTLATEWHLEVARLLYPFVGGGSLVAALAYLGVVLAVLGVATLLTVILLRLRRLLFIGWLDQIGGGLFGAAQGAVLAAMALILMLKYPTMGLDQAVKHSELGPRLLEGLPRGLSFLPPELGPVADFFRLPKAP